MALGRRPTCVERCLISGSDRTSLERLGMSLNDPLNGCRKADGALHSPLKQGLATFDHACGLLGACRDRKGNGRAKNVVGIIGALGFDDTLSIIAEAFRGAIRIAFRKQVGITAGKGDRIEGVKRGMKPSLISALIT